MTSHEGDRDPVGYVIDVPSAARRHSIPSATVPAMSTCLPSLLVLAASLTLVGCPSDPPDFIECRDDTSCYEGGRCIENPVTEHTFCAYPDGACPSGLRWSDLDVEQSISGTCVVEAAPDANGDAMPDAMVDGGIDAMPPDANPDPCGLRLAFHQGADGAREVWVSDPDGSNAVNVSNSGADDLNPTWSPDGTKLAFQSNRNGNWDIVIVGADGTGLTNITMGVTLDDERPQWSPDGTMIAFVRNTHVYVLFTTGGVPIEVSSRSVTSTGLLAWSPDSTKILFGSPNPSSTDLYVVDAVMSATAVNITNTSTPETSWDWAPASRIAFTGYDTNSRDVFAVDPDGSDLLNVTDNDATVSSARWAPDGSVIVYTSNDAGSSEVWRIPATGGTAVQVTDNNLSASGAGDYVQGVSPDGAWVVFDRRTSSTTSEVGVVGIDGAGLDTFTVSGGTNARGARWSPCL